MSLERIRSESGSESYVMMMSRGSGIEIARNEAVHEAVHVMGVRGMSPIRHGDVKEGQRSGSNPVRHGSRRRMIQQKWKMSDSLAVSITVRCIP